MDSIKNGISTMRFLWGSGMICAAFAIASLFACTPVHSKATVEKIEIHTSEKNKACPYPALSDAKTCQNETHPKTI